MAQKRICPRCKKEFICLSNKNCFCNHYTLNDEQKQFLKFNYKGCLCEECLKEITLMNRTEKEKRNTALAEKLIRNLKSRNFDAYFCPTKQQAIKQVIDLIPPKSTVSWGGSASIRDGLTQAIHQGPYNVLDRDLAPTEDEKRDIYLKTFSADYFLTGVNAISQDGVLVNIDRNGNRLAAITFGPKHVIFFVGINKVAPSVESALERARNVAAPTNAWRFDINTPCKQDGLCHNCKSEDCICAYIHFTRFSFPKNRLIVILVGEDLGF